MNLNEIMFKIKECEDAVVEIPEEFDGDLKKKIDGYHEMIIFWEAQEKSFKELADEYYDKANKKKNDVKRLKEYLMNTMEKFEWDTIKGEKAKATFIKSEYFGKNLEPTADTFALLPNLVNAHTETFYSWNMDALKEAYEKEPDVYRAYGETKIKKFVKVK